MMPLWSQALLPPASFVPWVCEHSGWPGKPSRPSPWACEIVWKCAMNLLVQILRFFKKQIPLFLPTASTSMRANLVKYDGCNEFLCASIVYWHCLRCPTACRPPTCNDKWACHGLWGISNKELKVRHEGVPLPREPYIAIPYSETSKDGESSGNNNRNKKNNPMKRGVGTCLWLGPRVQAQ